MALYPPPTESLPVFNPAVFQNATNTLSIGDLKSQFLQFPISQTAQETINQLAITTSGTYKTQTYKQTTNLTELATIGYVNDAAAGAGGGIASGVSGGTAGSILTQTGVPATPTTYLQPGIAGQYLRINSLNQPAWVSSNVYSVVSLNSSTTSWNFTIPSNLYGLPLTYALYCPTTPGSIPVFASGVSFGTAQATYLKGEFISTGTLISFTYYVGTTAGGAFYGTTTSLNGQTGPGTWTSVSGNAWNATFTLTSSSNLTATTTTLILSSL